MFLCLFLSLSVPPLSFSRGSGCKMIADVNHRIVQYYTIPYCTAPYHTVPRQCTACTSNCKTRLYNNEKLSIFRYMGIKIPNDKLSLKYRMISYHFGIGRGLMITFYHCPYTRTNTCIDKKFEYTGTTPDASRWSLFFVALLHYELFKTCEG